LLEQFLKAFVPALLGKTLMTFTLVYSGQQSLELIKTIFGETGLIGTVITAGLLMVIIVAMIKIEWEKLCDKNVDLKS
jgi:hypothetical protein